MRWMSVHENKNRKFNFVLDWRIEKIGKPFKKCGGRDPSLLNVSQIIRILRDFHKVEVRSFFSRENNIGLAKGSSGRYTEQDSDLLFVVWSQPVHIFCSFESENLQFTWRSLEWKATFVKAKNPVFISFTQEVSSIQFMFFFQKFFQALEPILGTLFCDS